MSKHPRTDAAYKNGRYSGMDFYDFACEMEDELDAAKHNGTVTMEELSDMRNELAEANERAAHFDIQLTAWQSTFETNQLSHARARLEAAEDGRKRFERFAAEMLEQNKGLTFRIAANTKDIDAQRDKRIELESKLAAANERAEKAEKEVKQVCELHGGLMKLADERAEAAERRADENARGVVAHISIPLQEAINEPCKGCGKRPIDFLAARNEEEGKW